MRQWLIVYYRGIPFVIGYVNEDKSDPRGFVSETFSEGDFFILSHCSAAELPYPFWFIGTRTVYVRDYWHFVNEYSGHPVETAFTSNPTPIGVKVEK
jgi:hypothetical protein